MWDASHGGSLQSGALQAPRSSLCRPPACLSSWAAGHPLLPFPRLQDQRSPSGPEAGALSASETLKVCNWLCFWKSLLAAYREKRAFHTHSLLVWGNALGPLQASRPSRSCRRPGPLVLRSALCPYGRASSRGSRRLLPACALSVAWAVVPLAAEQAALCGRPPAGEESGGFQGGATVNKPLKFWVNLSLTSLE